MTAIDLENLLSQTTDPRQRVAWFALLSLGAIESLVSGAIRASDAIRLLFHADNCLFVRERLQEESADEVMSRGVQLPDLFETLPAEEAQREYQRELAAMHSLCLKLIEAQESAAA
jgi:hypothetical protein